MSQIEYRRRLRQRAEALRTGNLATFRAQQGVGRAPTPPAAQQEAEPATDTEEEYTESTSQYPPGAPVESPVAPTQEPAFILPKAPEGEITPAQMRDHAAAVAQVLAQLSQDQYEAALADLQQNETLYAIVVDELNNMAAAADQEEGDGFDLSPLTGAASTDTDAVETQEQPQAQEGAGEDQEPQAQ